ncbi:MAG: hypothetical protein LC624_02370, partial [Halobacteriales archaeon]|nr:hypothetical protein [Halobacteriales archaeon]
DLRKRLRSIKEQLERKIIEVEAKAEGVEAPTEEPPVEELIAAFEEMGPELVAAADKALKKKVSTVEKLKDWEEPLAGLNSYLSDSEPFGDKGKMPAVRKDIKDRKAQLQARIAAMIEEWRQRDLAGGDADEEEE